MVLDLTTTTATTKDIFGTPVSQDTKAPVAGYNSKKAQSRAVEYMDGRLVFDPTVMDPRRPYLFHFLDHWMAVRRTVNSDLEFFYFSDESVER